MLKLLSPPLMFSPFPKLNRKICSKLQLILPRHFSNLFLQGNKSKPSSAKKQIKVGAGQIIKERV